MPSLVLMIFLADCLIMEMTMISVKEVWQRSNLLKHIIIICR